MTAHADPAPVPAGNGERLDFPETDALLRDDVRRLGAMVGTMLAEQVSPELLELVEAVRRAAIARREHAAPVDVLAARAMRAYHEWVPTPAAAGPVYRRISYGPLLDVFVLDMRTYKDVNDGNTYPDPKRGLLGAEWAYRRHRGLA
jgi:hypothetical protein